MVEKKIISQFNFGDAGVVVSCKGLNLSELERVKRYLSDLGLKIVSVNIKPAER